VGNVAQQDFLGRDLRAQTRGHFIKILGQDAELVAEELSKHRKRPAPSENGKLVLSVRQVPRLAALNIAAQL
jgi:hypothetical protein